MFDKIKKLVNHTAVYGLGNVGNRFAGFLLIPLYSYYLTPADYGVLALVGMLGQVLFVLANMGQGSALFRTYFLHDTPEERQTVISTSLWIILGLSLPICFLAFLFSQPLTSLLTGNADYVTWVMIGIGGVAVKILLRMPLAVLRAREESRRYALSMFVDTIVSIVFVIFLVVSVRLGGLGVMLGQALGDLLICLYLFPVTLRELNLTFSRQDANDMLGYGIYLMPSGLFSFILHLSDRFFLRYFASLSSVGLYSLGYRMGEILSFPLQALELAWPQFLFSNYKGPDAQALYARVSTYVVVLMGFLWLTVSLLAKEVVTIMTAPAYHEAYRVVPWIAGAFFFQGLNIIGSIGIDLQRKVKYRPLILATTAGLNIGLNFLLIPRYEMIGAAIANFTSFAFQALFRALVSYRLYPISYEYRRLIRIFLCVAALYAANVFVEWGALWTALVGKAVLLMSFPILLYLSGFFQPGEIEQLQKLLRRLRQRPGNSLTARSSSE
ncbi:MAG: lipopolysaccharide biosynthesis protein [Candidatus Binatia bacterium]